MKDMLNSRFHSWLDDYFVAKIVFIVFVSTFTMMLLGGMIIPWHPRICALLALPFISAVFVSRLHYYDYGTRFLYKRVKD